MLIVVSREIEVRGQDGVLGLRDGILTRFSAEMDVDRSDESYGHSQ